MGLTLSLSILFLWDYGLKAVFCNFFILTEGAIFLEWKMSDGFVASLCLVLVAHLHMQTEQATIIFLLNIMYIYIYILYTNTIHINILNKTGFYNLLFSIIIYHGYHSLSICVDLLHPTII